MTKIKKGTNNKDRNFITKGIFTVLEKDPSESFNYKQIAAKLGITDANTRNILVKRLVQLKEKKRILEESRGKYKAVARSSKTYHTGKVDVTSKGNAYIVIEGLDDDVFIASNKLKKAFHRDIVEVYIFPRRKGRKLEGEITRIIERDKTNFVGIVQLQKNYAFVTSTDFRMYTDFFIPKEKINNAQDGDKVIVKLSDWPDDADSPYGEIIEVLGKPGEHNTEIHSILAEYGLPYQFPLEVESYANKIDTSIKPEEIAKRRDMRDTLTFTIDPKDAKDFDDALSFVKLENGNYEIGIHIADVSHYLEPDTILDDEAYQRATSVYLVDRVVPMLPEVLSNNACSLRPNEEKYTFSAVFEINEQAMLINQWLVEQ